MSITSGHLSNNGGVRGHSAGDIFPWRILITGTFDNLKYWIVNPAGKRSNTPYTSTKEAYAWAVIFSDPILDNYMISE